MAESNKKATSRKTRSNTPRRTRQPKIDAATDADEPIETVKKPRRSRAKKSSTPPIESAAPEETARRGDVV